MPEAIAGTLNERLRSLPSVDDLLGEDLLVEVSRTAGASMATAIARDAIASLRSRLLDRAVDDGIPTDRSGLLKLALEIAGASWSSLQHRYLTRVINATGVVIHTNLGRAPLSEEAKRALVETASGYCTLEYDISTGKRGPRGGAVERMICELTGAEAVVVVNNCAAAAVLVLAALADGGEVIVSRGELVEIGGDFRIPDVLVQSGCTLREVGTTNRTKASDYENAIGDNTAMIMRVHPSNYRIVGFTAAPENAELSEVAKKNGVIFFEDAGSGAMTDLGGIGLSDEPVIAKSIKDGVDVVAFSGDKLLGGPQSGIIVGNKDLIDKIRRHPLYRALRVDKLIYAALEATLGSYLRGSQLTEVPVMRMLSMSADEIAVRSRSFISELSDRLSSTKDVSISVIGGSSAVGGGASPDVQPETSLIAISHTSFSVAELEESLRNLDPPVICRIEDEKLLIDLRTVDSAELPFVIDALTTALNAN
ncbi:MAG: L-seryl-tRNA(Sec) selenium transferase [Pyrinomonadaceae bacterium]|nr:L-seryl-tRNA(Sec) selenium transferase [Pyrinomonadaceae bacterium]